MDSDVTMLPAAEGSAAPGPSSSTKKPKRFEIKKWNAVALWAWDIGVDNCAICRNHIMDLCIKCQANQASATSEECTVAWEYFSSLHRIKHKLLPNLIIHSCRNNRPPLTLSVLSKLFGLGLLGICLLQVCAYAGINYSSPSLAAALGNLIPAFTFMFAIIFRMEKFDIRKSTSQAKALGTIVAITGAFVMTFYQGPPLFNTILGHDLNKNTLSSQQSNWVLGSLLITITCICSSSWIFKVGGGKDEYTDADMDEIHEDWAAYVSNFIFR